MRSATLSLAPEGQGASAVVVVSDGAVNAGEDPVAAGADARRSGPRRGGGGAALRDRALVGVESSSEARVGNPTPVRVRVTTTEERGIPITVHLTDGGREVARSTVFSPGPGQEVAADCA